MLSRLLVPLFLAAPLWAQQPPALPKPQPAAAPVKDPSRVEGTVTSQAGAPLAQATVRLDPLVRPLGLPAGGLTATTDAQGKFTIENIGPGRYTLTATRQGFIAQKYGAKTSTAPGTVLNLDTQQRLTGIDLRLTPQGVIRGRVYDQDGDPAVNALVQTLRLEITRTGQRLALQAGSQTNDQGEFTLQNIAPGRYYLIAEPAPDLQSALPGYIPTLYPNGLDLSGATMIEVGPGANIQGIDFRLRREATYTISGKIIDSTSGAPVANTYMDWIAKGARGMTFDRRIYTTRADGGFDIRNLLPGSYVIELMQGGTIGAVARDMTLGMTGRWEVTVTDSDFKNVVLSATPGSDISGVFRTETPEESQAISFAGISLTAVPVDGPITVPSRVNPDGTFALNRVSAGAYTLDVENLPVTAYIKSIRVDGRDATHSAMNLIAGQNNIEVTLSSKAAQLSGSVTASNGDPLSGISVSLWTRNPDAGSVSRGAYSAVTDQSGQFQFNRLPPGEYFVLAWEEIEPGVAQYYPFLELSNSRATRIEVAEGGRDTVTPKLLTAADVASTLTRLNLTPTAVFSSNGKPPAPPDNDTPRPIMGRVTDSKGQPISKATVRINATNFSGQAVALTASDGRFAFEQAPVTSFEIQAEKTGYLTQRLGASKPGTDTSAPPAAKITLKSGESIRDVELALTPQGVIAGVVTTVGGQPAAGVQVAVIAQETRSPNNLPSIGFGLATGPDGSYRLANLAPGRYYVSANPRGAFTLAGGRSTGPAAPEADLRTFYPSVTDLSRATLIEVEPGGEQRGVNIQLVHSRVFTVRGKASLPDGAPIQDQIFSIRSAEKGSSNPISGSTTVPDRDGSFEFQTLAPGTYQVIAGVTRLGNSYASPTLFGIADVVITDADIADLALPVTPGIAISGTVSVENSSQRVRPAIQLASPPDTAVPFATFSDFNEDGTFRMRGIPPGPYLLGVFNFPPGFYLKSAELSGQDLLHAPARVSETASRLSLVFGSDPARLEGTVKTPSGDPAKSVIVSLWPREPLAGITDGAAKFVSTSPKGTFEFSDLAPGDYYVAAWEDIAMPLVRNVDFPSRMQASAAQVTLRGNTTVTVEAPWISKAKVDEELEKSR